MALRPLIFRFHSFLVMQKACVALRLIFWLRVFDRDILHECITTQPNLVLTVVDIWNLPRSGFVSMFDFLDLVWGKVSLHSFNGVQRTTSLKNLTPFRKDLPCEEKV